jgi:hypothetical protein
MGIFDFFKKKKETEFDKDDTPEEVKKKKRPMQYSKECDKLSEELQKCVSKNNGS